MKYLIFTTLLLITSSGIAQTGRSIEVTVSDTVTLKALSGSFLLKINVDESMYYESEYEGEYTEEESYEDEPSYTEMYEESAEKSKKNKRKRKKEEQDSEKDASDRHSAEEYSFEEIVIPEPIEDGKVSEIDIDIANRKKQWIDFLVTNNIMFDTIPSKGSGLNNLFEGMREYEGDYGSSSVSIEIKAANITQINAIYQFMDSVNFCQLNKKDIVYETYDQKMESIYKNLYKKAQQESIVLAKVIGGNPGKVIRVFEPSVDLADLIKMSEDTTKRYMRSMEGEYGTIEDRKVVIERTFVFELK